eukprot:6210356-Pleurochrysis_carterae.AAC.3
MHATHAYSQFGKRAIQTVETDGTFQSRGVMVGGFVRFQFRTCRTSRVGEDPFQSDVLESLSLKKASQAPLAPQAAIACRASLTTQKAITRLARDRSCVFEQRTRAHVQRSPRARAQRGKACAHRGA